MRGMIKLLVLAGLALCVTYGGVTVLGQSGPCYSAGCLDPTFGTDGMATYTTLTAGEVNRMAVQVVNEEDRIVAVAGSGWTVARFLPDGALDTSFGTNGIIKRTYQKGYALSSQVVVQSDGKILVLGTVPTGPKNTAVVVVTRYQPDGKAYDTSFGTGGTVAIAPPAGARPFRGGEWALTLQGDKVLVALSSDSDSDPYTAPFIDLHVVRLDNTGRFDNSFGPDPNTAFATFPNAGNPMAMLVQRIPVSETAFDERIVLAVRTLVKSGPTYSVSSVRRLTPNGAPDPSFAQSGVAEMGVPGALETIFYGVAVDGSNRIVAAGGYSVDPNNDQNPPFETHAQMARYLPDGSLDGTFAVGGVLPLESVDGDFGDVVIQPDGNILASAFSYGPAGFRVLRYTNEGWPDVAFGVDGSTAYSTNIFDAGPVLVRRPDDGFGTNAFIVGGSISVSTTARGRTVRTWQPALWRYFY